MMKLSTLLLRSLALLVSLYGALAWANSSAPIKVGVVAFAHPDNVTQRWQATVSKLENDLQRPFTLVVLPPEQLDERVKLGELDFLITNALMAVSYKKDFGSSSILTLIPTVSADPTRSVGSALITRAESKVASLADLKQLNAISSDRKAFGGFQIYAGEMAAKGLNPFNDFKSLEFVGFPQRKLLSMLTSHKADIAILPTCVLESAIKDGRVEPSSLKVVLTTKSDDFHCLTSSQLYPDYSFSKLGKTDHQLATAVIRSLLTIQASDQAAIQGQYVYWSATVNDSKVFSLLRQLQQWPFVTN